MSLPNQLVCYKKTNLFSIGRVPELLLQRHNNAAGVWGKIVVERGQVGLTTYVGDTHFVEKRKILTQLEHGMVEPKQWHRLRFLTPNSRFRIEFHRDMGDESNDLFFYYANSA